ncbi:MAG: protein kinase [Chthonomonadaceae bacterium]|nr:protein kinase [Chthonomonadaceae bacterium]
MDISGYVLETLREGGEFALYRGRQQIDSDSVLVLAPVADRPASESLKRLEYEYALAAELDPEWAVRPLALAQHAGRTVLVLEDADGEPLDRVLGRPLEAAPFLRIAIGLATALGQVHQHGFIHKDIQPANVIVDAKGSVRLTGFGIASRLPREHQAPAPPEVIAGALAYMAPEQTGRMNRSVDSRSDLYALGVTFYEMLTGTLPFTASDPLEWVHCHIARQPVPPDERVAGIPEPLSSLVMKLLAKTAEERYQTAAGLVIDLRRCLTEWEAHARIDPFPLGAHDVPDRLLIPETLYGREREIDALLAAFDRVMANGTTELVLVSGYAGIGKSSVVNELHRALVPTRGLFASGKFDQYKRDVPYATLAQAFQSLVRSLLSQSEAELGRWRDALSEALGSNAPLIVNLIPELELVIGKQASIPDLSPQDAQNRFQMTFRRFLGVFVRKEYPLVLFLDDLQWLDTATLDLLEHLVTHSEVRQLLLVGAYRDNEVGLAHPLVRTLEAIREAGGRVEQIILAPLDLNDVGRLVTDTLHCEAERAQPLAQLVHEKTGGNPFFAIQFFTALAEEELLAFDPVTQGWQWDMDRIRARNYTDNVVDLMTGKLKRLSDTTQEALQQFACLGNVAELATLALVHGKTEEAMDAALWEAVHTGLVFHQGSAYKFLHDRIQQAAYSLIPDERCAGVHLHIGRVLLASMTADGLAEHLFEIVNQFNRGAALITARDEQEQLAELNLSAGKRAKASTAYTSALTYLVAGAALLAADSWERRHELAFALELNRAECEFLTGALAEAEQRLAALSDRAVTTLERAGVTCLRADLYTTLDQGSHAIAVGLDYLRHLGIDWSPHPTEDEARREYERIWSHLGSRAVERLIDLPLMSDPVSLASLDVLTKMATPALYTDANLYLLVICRQVNLSLEHGNCDASCFAYEWLAMVAGARFGDYTAAYNFGRLGYDLVVQRGLKRFQARTYLIFGGLIIPWTRHVKSGRDLLRRSFEAANEIGDLTYAAYSCDQLNANMLAAGDSLIEAQREFENGLEFARKVRFGLVIDLISAELGIVRTLRGLTRKFGSFDDEQFNEREIERRFAGNPDLALAECWYSIRKLQARFFAGDYTTALEAASTAQRLLWTSVSRFETAEYHFYSALSHAAACDSAADDQRRRHIEAVTAHHSQLEVWAVNCPDNFENRAALVGAEIARIAGRDVEAMHLYEQAIRSARRHGFVHNEGLAYEAAARFYAARGFETFAHTYRRNARDCYRRWGAEGKVQQIEQLHPHLREELPAPPQTTTIRTPVEHLDLATVIKVSQAVSGEIVHEKLIDTLMHTALEHAGAERGLLILPRGDEQRIEAEATTGRDAVTVRLLGTLPTPSNLPNSILQYVVRTHESVILEDASAPNPFSTDAYIHQNHARSVLCLPLIKQARLIGVLYLENNLTPHAFTPARIAVLKLLASQAAISLENTHLYTDLQQREAKIRRLFDLNIIGIVIAESGGQLIDANDAFLKMTGYDRDDLVTRQAWWLEMTPPEWVAASQRALAQMRATGSCDPFEKEYIRKDGSRVPVLVGAATVEGSRDESVAFMLDLTERNRANEARRESESWQSLTEALPQLVWAATPDGACDYFSTQWTEYTGVPESDLLGWRWMDVLHPDDREPTRQLWMDSVAGRSPYDVEYRVRQWDGVYGWFQTRGTPIRDSEGNIVKWFGTCTDITDRKRAEEALRQSEQELRKARNELEMKVAERTTELRRAAAYLAEAQELSHTGSLGWDVSSGQIYWSDETFRIFEYDPATQPTVELVIARTHPEDRMFVRQTIERAASERCGFDFEHRLRMSDGSVKYVRVVAHPSTSDEPGGLLFVGAVTDITESKQAVEALRTAQVELAHVTRVTTLGELTSSIAHEVNQPLTAVVSNGNACLRWLAAQPPNLDEARQAVGRIIKDGHRASEVVGRIRALVKKTPPRRDWLDINEILLEVIALANGEVQRHHVSLQTQLSLDLPRVRGDRIQLQQVILNLVINGIEAMSGVNVETRQLWIRSRQHGANGALVMVCDSGTGLGTETLAHLFDAFYTTKPAGMGMGLAISRSIIEAHGGRLWAEPNAPQGAVFQFTLSAEDEREL